MAGEKFVDTSVVVRYLTGDPPKMAEQATAILDHSSDLVVTDVALAETAFVLTSVYRIPRERVVDSLVQLVQKPNLAIFGLDKDVVTNALLLGRPSGRISFSNIHDLGRGSLGPRHDRLHLRRALPFGWAQSASVAETRVTLPV